MKQVLQDLSSREVRVEEIPRPSCLPEGVLVRTVASLISSGTERTVISLGTRTLLGKALERPDLVARFWRRVRMAGLKDALATARARLETSMALGYSSAGVVQEVGLGAEEFAVGDRVACAGSGYAAHAELNWVPRNLCARIPEELTFEDAAFGAVGSVALQAVRVAEVKLGERVAVIGLGLVGQLVIQILRAAGCTVWGLDPDPERVKLAHEIGADFACENHRWRESPWDNSIRRDCGMDAVIITASTRFSEPVETAGVIARDRGVVVVVGDVRADIPRETYYGKELQVRYSRSYGPGRYDPTYEERGVDYPYGFVRWTENRNLRAYLELAAKGKVPPQALITHRFPIEKACEAYKLLSGERQERHLGILLTYPGTPSAATRVLVPGAKSPHRPWSGERTSVGIGWIGAGSFSRGTLLPLLRKIDGVERIGLANAGGITARRAAQRFRFRYCATAAHEILHDPNIAAIFIATPHHLHASLVGAALEQGKHVFVEKPLCVNQTELTRIASLYARSHSILTVGFNRRFSPFATQCREFFQGRCEPLTILYRINAGPLHDSHWTSDPERGHGRIIGEICHFVDFAQFLIRSPIKEVQAWPLATGAARMEDNLQIHLTFADGSHAEITFLSSGDLRVPKERIEMFSQGRTAITEDFRRSIFWCAGRRKTQWSLHQDKGHRGELRAFLRTVAKGLPPPIPFEDLYSVTLATFRIREALLSGRPVSILET